MHLRYFNQELLVEIMESLGCKLITHHNSKKLAHFMFHKEGEQVERKFKKENLRNGVNRNNFFIQL